MGVICNVFHRHRLAIIYAQGKTELLYTHTGAGSRAHRRPLHAANHAPPIPAPANDQAPHVWFRTTDRYNYLGATLHAADTFRYEVRKRASRARIAANDIPLNILCDMQLCHRATVIGALAATQLLYASESWTPKHTHDLIRSSFRQPPRHTLTHVGTNPHPGSRRPSYENTTTSFLALPASPPGPEPHV